LLFAVSVKADHNNLDNRDLSRLQCRCEAPGENLYNRRLDQETDAFDDNDNSNDNQDRQLVLFSSNGYYIIRGVQVLPSSNAACSSRRDLEESYIHMNEEDTAELEQMDVSEGIFKSDKTRKLPYSDGYEYGYALRKGSKGSKGSNGYGYVYKGSSSNGQNSVSRVQIN
jgi:hypothetical protein